jgi:hypothetical protein
MRFSGPPTISLFRTAPLIVAVAATLCAVPLAAHDIPGGRVPHGPAGHDKPGPPPIQTTATLLFIEYPMALDQDDAGADIEIGVTTSVKHEGHGAGTRQVSDEDLPWSETKGTWFISEDIYTHRECTPMEPLTLSLTGYEADASNLDTMERIILSILVDLSQLDRYVLDSSILEDLIALFFATINPDDYLGAGATIAPTPGIYDVTTSGGDYSITGTYTVVAPAQPGNECDPDSVPQPPGIPPWCYFSIAFFDSLWDVWWEADNILIEPGDPGDVTPQDLDDAKSSVRSLAVCLAQWAAVHMLEDAQGLAGFTTAKTYYDQGKINSAPYSILDFREAFCTAELAIDNAIPDPSAPVLPRHGVAVPTMFATRSGRSVDALVGVFGIGAPAISIASVTGGPPGMTYTLTAVDPQHPSWRKLRLSQNGPPGTYAVTVAFNNPVITPIVLTLDIDDANVPTSVDDRRPAAAPDEFTLYEVRPNPLVATGSIRLDLPAPAMVTLSIYDVAGRRVHGIVSEIPRGAGTHFFAIDGSGLAAGVYYARVEARPEDIGSPPFRAVRKLVIAR